MPSAAHAGVDYRQAATGDVVVTWRGDPARGCEEAGVCGIAGSARLESGLVNGGIEGDLPDASLVLETLDLAGGPSAVRVVRGPLESPFGACTDTLGNGAIRLVPTVAGGRVRIRPLMRPGGGPGFLGGRCAGPLGVDLGEALPSVTVSLRRLMQGRTVFDLRGRTSFGSGAFSGEVVSTLVVRRTARRTPSRSRDGTVSQRIRAESATHTSGAMLELRFRLAGSSGALVTDFTGAPAPFCQGLDACGLRGTHELAARLPGGRPRTLRLLAYGPRSALGGRRTVAAALEALAAGRLQLGGDGLGPRVPATSSATVTWPEGPPCRDAREAAFSGLRVTAGRAVVFRLREFQDPEAVSNDPFRTRCPGPAIGDVAGDILAVGSVPLARLADERVSLRMAAPAPPTGDDFTVATRGELVLDLERVSARLETGR